MYQINGQLIINMIKKKYFLSIFGFGLSICSQIPIMKTWKEYNTWLVYCDGAISPTPCCAGTLASMCQHFDAKSTAKAVMCNLGPEVFQLKWQHPIFNLTLIPGHLIFGVLEADMHNSKMWF